MKAGDVLKKLRKQTGLNQADFANMVGLDNTRISKYENEVDRISLEMFLNWCKKLNINPKDVFD